MEMPIGARFAAMRGMRRQVQEVQNWLERRNIVGAVTTLEDLEEAFEYFSPHLDPTNTAKFRSAIKDVEEKIRVYKVRAEVIGR